MLRIIAALSLAAMLGASAIPAVAHDLNESGDLFNEDGKLAIFGEVEELDGFFVAELEDLEDLLDAGFLSIDNGDEEEDLTDGADQGSEQEDVESGDLQLSIGSSTGGSTGGSVTQGFEQEDVESGDVEPSVSISNRGDNANMCSTVLQSANSGNVLNAQGAVQYQSEADDIEFGGSSITIAPEAAGSCEQTIQQSAAASG